MRSLSFTPAALLLGVKDLPQAAATVEKRPHSAQLPWDAWHGRLEPDGAYHPAQVRGGPPPPARAVGLGEQGCRVNFTQRAAVRAAEGKREEARHTSAGPPTALGVCWLTHGAQTPSLFKKPSQPCSES